MHFTDFGRVWAGVLLSALLVSELPSAEAMPEFVDVQGKRHTPLVIGDKKGAVLIFVSPFCPTSNAFMPEANKIAAAYSDRFAFYFVEADAGISLPDAQKHAEVMEFKVPVLLDPKQELAKRVQAKMTPETVVLNAKGEVLYQGRINDLYVTQTKKLPEPKTHDLREALEAIAAGKMVANPKTKAIGCSITIEK